MDRGARFRVDRIRSQEPATVLVGGLLSAFSQEFGHLAIFGCLSCSTVKNQPFLVPENVLLRKLNRRDEVASQWLYDQYAHVLYGVILTSLGQSALAGQVLEMVFVNAWADFDQFDPRKTRLLTWLLSRTRAEVAAASAKMESSATVDKIDYEVIDNPIPQEQRILINAVYFRGESVSELAEFSKQPEQTVQHRLVTVLQELKILFSQ